MKDIQYGSFEKIKNITVNSGGNKLDITKIERGNKSKCCRGKL